MITQQAVIDQARSWVGVKYQHQGRTRMGCDCIGFIAAFMAELDSWTLIHNLPIDYARDPQSLLSDGLTALTSQIGLVPGSLILFKFPKAEHASHAAIYTGDSMIHAHEPNKQVVEHGYRGPWLKYTNSIWSLPMVTY